jgi:hypothetical protein
MSEQQGGAEWSRAQYVAQDGSRIYLLTLRGLIPPPHIELHEPLIGRLRFTYAGSEHLT